MFLLVSLTRKTCEIPVLQDAPKLYRMRDLVRWTRLELARPPSTDVTYLGRARNKTCACDAEEFLPRLRFIDREMLISLEANYIRSVAYGYPESLVRCWFGSYPVSYDDIPGADVAGTP